ncbi:MAG: ISKra4 family transposase, partial [Thermoanaerobaculaceae bacterium]|nr:ISKra4 family transposase [Thermoanaerobaculaceae bacterium]
MDLETIISFLKSGEAKEMKISDLEATIRDRAWEVLRDLLQAHIDARGPGEAAAPVVDAEGVERTAGPREHERTLTSVFGDVTVRRLGYGKEGLESLHPLDAELNLPAEQYSFGLRRLAAVEVAKGSFEEAVASLKGQTGAELAKRQVEQLVRRAAQDFDAFYELRAPPAGSGGEVLVISVDGKGVVMRRSDLREATRKAAEARPPRFSHRLTKGEKRNAKRMATVATVYTIAANVREPTDIVRALAPRHERVLSERPRPESKRVWASLEKEAEEVIAEAFVEAERRDPHHERRWVAVVDGNGHQLRVLRRIAKRHKVDLTMVLDFIHVSQYVWKASLGFFGEKEAGREDWVEERLLRILSGGSSQVAAGIRRSATRRRLSKSRRKAVDACAKYLLGHTRYLRYDQYLAAGLPIATGVVEGACRHLVSDRMDVTGARWSL